jgi:hypothetical protein
MIQITLKAKHYYFIAFHLKNTSLQQYYSVINKIKIALTGNTDLEATFNINVTIGEVINMYKVLTVLPEGVSNKPNSEMDDLLTAQTIAGMMDEISNGNGPDAEGNIPEFAYWHMLGQAITGLKAENIVYKNNIINNGKLFLDTL